MSIKMPLRDNGTAKRIASSIIDAIMVDKDQITSRANAAISRIIALDKDDLAQKIAKSIVNDMVDRGMVMPTRTGAGSEEELQLSWTEMIGEILQEEIPF